ncbi:hypothetical protein LCGC14_2511520 [marine sediment metagenome]|uniref:NAD-dependent epimerase/dehydratase domain-containing protein n=1 Tax=marine sediment metagenome TaxID=412755 RepID=A0A0F9DAS1_9ZZZZ
MKICVTGSAGFIGRATVDALLAKGHSVLAIDRHEQPGLSGDGVLRAKMDIMDERFVRDLFDQERPEAVIHLAANASLQRSLTDTVYDAMQNVIGTVSILSAAQHIDCKRFVFASTSAVYGPQDSGMYSEDDLVQPQVPYGVSKAAGEMYVRSSGLSYAILRYGNVYGPKQKPLGENILIARTLAHMKDGEPFSINGDGEQTRDWIYVEDVVDANLAALLSSADGTFNISTGIGISVNEVVERLRIIVGSHEVIEHNPPSKGELRNVILKSRLAREKLGWRSVIPLEIGLRATAEAWK